MSHKIHDLKFKELMTNKDFVISFCKAYLPDEIRSRIDWSSLNLYKLSGEVVQKYSSRRDGGGERKKQTRNSDVLFLFKYDGSFPGMLLFHSEHQSNPQKRLLLRFMNYLSGALLDYCKIYKKNKLPVIISNIVLPWKSFSVSVLFECS